MLSEQSQEWSVKAGFQKKVVHPSRKTAGLDNGSMAGWGDAKGNPSEFSLPWLSSKKLLYQGLEKGLRQARSKGGSYQPPHNITFRVHFQRKARKGEGTEVIRPRIRMSIGGVSSANSGASFPREDRGPSCRRVDGWMPQEDVQEYSCPTPKWLSCQCLKFYH